ncbi:BBE domain-containing protein [Streptomyces collinus]|uniref:BBE domain-containing protein n=1 Tax=Streptomyces collinus TaxID=42684 RepID=UPI003F541EAE
MHADGRALHSGRPGPRTSAPRSTSTPHHPCAHPTLKNWREAYYGSNYPRLVKVKRKYDPTGFFHYPQAIGTR